MPMMDVVTCCHLGSKVGGRLVLFCIHRVNWVNSRNDFVTESW